MKTNRKTAATLLTAGIIGGAVALGGNAVYDHFNTTGTALNTSSTATKVDNTAYKVTSDTTKAISKVSDAVVSVINYQKAPESGSSIDDLFGDRDNATKKDDAKEQPAAEGSGVIYKKDGDTAYVVTNNHVVDGASSLEILLANGNKVKGTLVGKDAYSDLAVIKMAAKDVSKVATFGDSTKLTVGEPAIAIGSPLGSQYANSATEGIISSLSRQVIMKNESNETVNILNFPITLKEAGATRAHIDRMLTAAKNPQLKMKLQNMPTPMDAEKGDVDRLMRPVLEAAFTGDLSLIP